MVILDLTLCYAYLKFIIGYWLLLQWCIPLSNQSFVIFKMPFRLLMDHKWICTRLSEFVVLNCINSKLGCWFWFVKMHSNNVEKYAYSNYIKMIFQNWKLNLCILKIRYASNLSNRIFPIIHILIFDIQYDAWTPHSLF